MGSSHFAERNFERCGAANACAVYSCLAIGFLDAEAQCAMLLVEPSPRQSRATSACEKSSHSKARCRCQPRFCTHQLALAVLLLLTQSRTVLGKLVQLIQIAEYVIGATHRARCASSCRICLAVRSDLLSMFMMCPAAAARTLMHVTIRKRRSRYCAVHKKDGMIVVLAGCCNAENCDKQPSFGFVGERPRFCATHKSCRSAPLVQLAIAQQVASSVLPPKLQPCASLMCVLVMVLLLLLLLLLLPRLQHGGMIDVKNK
eukprot:2195-Heterococcus_DN1.PRE.1